MSEVKQIYIEVAGDEHLSSQFRDSLAADIRSRGEVTIRNDLDGSDALLKVSVRGDNGNSTHAEPRVIVIARLANVTGDVIWPELTRGSGAKYIGTVAETSASIATDLGARIQKARRSR